MTLDQSEITMIGILLIISLSAILLYIKKKLPFWVILPIVIFSIMLSLGFYVTNIL
jgi:hypothetical protein